MCELYQINVEVKIRTVSYRKYISMMMPEDVEDITLNDDIVIDACTEVADNKIKIKHSSKGKMVINSHIETEQ